MRTLVIDTATDACSVALFDDLIQLAGEWRLLGRGHAESLIPMIAALPERGRAHRIAVSSGPGSFTGIRVGIAAARALGFAWNVPVSSYPTLDLVAAMARAEVGQEPVSVAMTGGHGEWFVARFDAEGMMKTGVVSLKPDAAMDVCQDEIVAGTQAATLIGARGSGRALDIWPDARSFALLPKHALQDGAAPLYGRQPDAKVAAQ
jgi:tRNA threonylcarbamoyl adenosine modification protein YeaZ